MELDLTVFPSVSSACSPKHSASAKITKKLKSKGILLIEDRSYFNPRTPSWRDKTVYLYDGLIKHKVQLGPAGGQPRILVVDWSRVSSLLIKCCSEITSSVLISLLTALGT